MELQVVFDKTRYKELRVIIPFPHLEVNRLVCLLASRLQRSNHKLRQEFVNRPTVNFNLQILERSLCFN